MDAGASTPPPDAGVLFISLRKAFTSGLFGFLRVTSSSSQQRCTENACVIGPLPSVCHSPTDSVGTISKTKHLPLNVYHSVYLGELNLQW